MRSLFFLCALSVASVLSERSAAAAEGPDHACVAENVYHEARGESPEGMVAVGWVVLNRSRDWGGKPCKVVRERSGSVCQFSWVCTNPRAPRGVDWSRSKAVASALMTVGGVPDPTGGATFFSVCGRRPARNLRQTARIGAHCFFAPRSADAAAVKDTDYQLRQDPDARHGWRLSFVAPQGEPLVELAQAPEKASRKP